MSETNNMTFHIRTLYEALEEAVKTAEAIELSSAMPKLLDSGVGLNGISKHRKLLDEYAPLILPTQAMKDAASEIYEAYKTYMATEKTEMSKVGENVNVVWNDGKRIEIQLEEGIIVAYELNPDSDIVVSVLNQEYAECVDKETVLSLLTFYNDFVQFTDAVMNNLPEGVRFGGLDDTGLVSMETSCLGLTYPLYHEIQCQ